MRHPGLLDRARAVLVLIDLQEGYRRALRFLVARCDRVLTVTAPLDLGRPLAAGNGAGTRPDSRPDRHRLS